MTSLRPLITKAEEKIILSTDKSRNLHNLSRICNLSYAYCHNLCKRLEQGDLLSIYKEGKENKLKLTQRGEKLKDFIIQIKNLLSINYNDKG